MQGRGHGKERQVDYEGENTSRDVGVCFVCHRHLHFARECPESKQGYRRGGGCGPGFGSDQRHQSRGQVNRNFREIGGQSFGGRGLASRTARHLGNKSVSRTVYQPIVNDVEVGDLILLMIVRQPVQFVITAVARVT